jgi:bacteriocin-like protein
VLRRRGQPKEDAVKSTPKKPTKLKKQTLIKLTNEDLQQVSGGPGLFINQNHGFC